MGHEKSIQGLQGEGTDKCPDCGSDRIVRKKGELYCEKCGMVID